MLNRFLAVAAATLAPLAAGSALAAPIVGGASSFTAVRAQIELAGCDTEKSPSCVVQTNLAPSLAEAGAETGAYATARAGFGVNGAYASVSDAQTDQEAYAESIWGDAFTVHGGVGTATAHITVRVDGALDGLGQPGGPGSNAFYGFFISDAPITCNVDEIVCTGSAAIPLTEPLSGTRYLQAEIQFTYDKPFYLASYLGAEVVGGQAGVADFFHSAHLSISAPAGASMTTGSGALYPSASAVPEPQAMLMFVAGVGCALRLVGKRPMRGVFMGAA